MQGIAPGRLSIPLYSTVTGGKVEPEELDAGYWYRNLRQTVRFADAVEQLLADGHRFFVEVSPHPVLEPCATRERARGGSECRDCGHAAPGPGEAERLLLSLGELHVRGLGCDWKSLLPAARPVPLPTYPFERQRYWLEAGVADGDVASAGLSSAEHPLLGASIAVAEGDSFVFTGRLSLATHPWLAGHEVFGAVLLPGAAFVELALAAAERVGLDTVDELTLEAPLVVPERGAVQLQVLVGTLEESKRRSLSVHARAAGDGEGGWTRHASGVLSAAAPIAGEELRDWPPAGAVAVELDGLYEGVAEAGLLYGDAFRGLRAVYRRGEELFAQVELPEAVSQEASRFGLHPALLDAALHALFVMQAPGSGVALPFAWSGVQLQARGACALRVRLSGGAAQGSVSVLLADSAGAPVGAVQALHSRPAVASQIRGASTLRDALYRVDWVVLPAPPVASSIEWAWLGDAAEGLPPAPSSYADLGALQAWLSQDHRAPALVVLPCIASLAHGSEETASAAHRATQQLLGTLQGILGTSGSRTAVWWWSPGVRLPRMPGKTCWTWRAPRCGAWCALRSPSTPAGSRCSTSIRFLCRSRLGSAPWARRSRSWGCARTSSARRDWLGKGQTSCWYLRMALLGRCRSRPEARSTTWCWLPRPRSPTRFVRGRCASRFTLPGSTSATFSTRLACIPVSLALPAAKAPALCSRSVPTCRWSPLATG